MGLLGQALNERKVTPTLEPYHSVFARGMSFRFRLNAASYFLCRRKLSRVEPSGFQRTDHQNLLLGVLLVEITGGVKHFVQEPDNSL